MTSDGAGKASSPRVSVLMTVHNTDEFVADAIESVLRQTMRDFELIIIDDGSTDGTPAILRHYAALDPRVIVIAQEQCGIASSRNRGLRAARAEWVAIIDADDICLPHRLERQLQALVSTPDIKALGSYAFEIDGRGRRLGELQFGPTTAEEFWRLRQANRWIGMINPSALLHRPTVLALGGYDTHFTVASDADLWSRLADEHQFLVLPEPLVEYRIHDNNVSSTRVFEMREMSRWITMRQRERRAGEAPSDLTTYRARWRRLPWRRRLRHRRNDLRHYATERRRRARIRGQRADALKFTVVMVCASPEIVASVVRRRLTSLTGREARSAM